jgi:hypothetical protein
MSFRARPPFAPINHRSPLRMEASLLRTNTILRPSGDHAGSESLPFRVSRRCWFPSARMTQIALRRSKAIRPPSATTLGWCRPPLLLVAVGAFRSRRSRRCGRYCEMRSCGHPATRRARSCQTVACPGASFAALRDRPGARRRPPNCPLRPCSTCDSRTRSCPRRSFPSGAAQRCEKRDRDHEQSHARHPSSERVEFEAGDFRLAGTRRRS